LLPADARIRGLALRRAPIRVGLLEPDDLRFDHQRELVGVPIRAAAAVGEAVGALIPIPVEDLAGLPRDPELRTQGGHRLAVQAPSYEPETLVPT
jgi:hypothetical protein